MSTSQFWFLRPDFTSVRGSCCLVLLAALAIITPTASGHGGDRSMPGYICSGNEPFWRIALDPTSAVLSRPGGSGVEDDVFAGRLDVFAYLDPPWSVWRGRNLGQDGGELMIVVREEKCLDTMADDAVFNHRAIVSFEEGPAAAGCCNKIAALNPGEAPPADFDAKTTDDWSRPWPDLAPAIHACLAVAQAEARSVVKAWPMNRGRIGVRLADDQARRFDCIVIDASGSVERMEPVDAAAPPLPGEGMPEFLPLRPRPLILTCGRLRRVVDADGATTGYLHYPEGCPAD